MKTGVLNRYNQEKGFGFITPDEGGSGLFAPKRTFVGQETSIMEGMKVTYQSDVEDRTGKPYASSWQTADGGMGMGMMGGGMMGAGIGMSAGMNNFSPYGGMQSASFSPMGAMTMPGMAMAAPAPVATNLPAGWEQATDPSSGKVYYCNRVTGESSWTVPTGGVDVAASAPAAAPAAASPALPAGWEQAADPASGKQYYFNRATGQTSWEPPTA